MGYGICQAWNVEVFNNPEMVVPLLSVSKSDWDSKRPQLSTMVGEYPLVLVSIISNSLISAHTTKLWQKCPETDLQRYLDLFLKQAAMKGFRSCFPKGRRQ